MERSPTHRALMRLTLTSLLAALIFCATFFLRIPIGAGYIHAGDGFVFISAVLLPAPYAAAAAAIGMGLADFFGGFALWIPVTVAVRVGSVLLFPHRGGFFGPRSTLALVLSALLTAGGYYLFEALAVYHGFTAALTGVPFNLLQSALGAILFSAFGKLAERHRLFS